MGRERKFTDEEVGSIRTSYNNGSLQKELATQYNVHRGTITKIVNGVTYADTFTGKKAKPGTKKRLRRFTEDQVKNIRSSLKSFRVFAHMYNVSPSTIQMIRKRITYKDVM